MLKAALVNLHEGVSGVQVSLIRIDLVQTKIVEMFNVCVIPLELSNVIVIFSDFLKKNL